MKTDTIATFNGIDTVRLKFRGISFAFLLFSCIQNSKSLRFFCSIQRMICTHVIWYLWQSRPFRIWFMPSLMPNARRKSNCCYWMFCLQSTVCHIRFVSFCFIFCCFVSFISFITPNTVEMENIILYIHPTIGHTQHLSQRWYRMHTCTHCTHPMW